MGSLKERLYKKTLPLAAAWNAATGGTNREPKLAEIAQYVTFTKLIGDPQLNVDEPDIDTFAKEVKAVEDKSVVQEVGELLPGPPVASRDFIPLWGYKAAGSYNTVNEVSCLVDEWKNDEFARMLVLSKIEFGDSPSRNPDEFSSSVTVYFKGKQYKLELGQASYVVSYLVHNAWTSGGDRLWKHKLKLDPSFVHVFLFDLVHADDGSLKIEPVTKADSTVLDPFYQADEALAAAARAGMDAPDVDARDVLFKDDLWTPHPKSQSPSGAVPSTVIIGSVVARFCVTCTLAVSRWEEESAPGRATGEAPIHPLIVIASTHDLDQASGGVRLTRPEKWNMLKMKMGKPMRTLGPTDIPKTMMDYMSPLHMTEEIDALMITDSNKDIMTVVDKFGPFVIWANLFNYYIDDPSTQVGSSPIKVVNRKRTKKLAEKDSYGYVQRDTSDVLPGLLGPMGIVSALQAAWNNTGHGDRVSKNERQGAFDNIHMAPRMKIPEGLIGSVVASDATLGGVHKKLTSADYAALKMDKIGMAPFCPHDCFHLHWRWTDNDIGDQIAVMGWEDEPNMVPGAPMVPHNQDVYVGLPNPHTILYLADIHEIPADEWQVILHHGAFYALTASWRIKASMLEIESRLMGSFYDAKDMLIPSDYYSLFYWRLRYKMMLQTSPGATNWPPAPGSGGSSLVAVERMTFAKGWKAAADR